jgi:exosortase C (VPDSG-CTERM-specific)
MKDPLQKNASATDHQPGEMASVGPNNLERFYIATSLLLVAFSLPLYQLVRFALDSSLFSHVWLIPFISLFLVWMQRHTLPPPSAPARIWALLPLAIAVLLLVFRYSQQMPLEDGLAYTTLALVLLFIGICFAFLGLQTVRAIAFPLGFLIFMVPFPIALTEWIEVMLQSHSASAASLFFDLSGATYFRHEQYFELPGIRLLIARECSGIHSTLGLFITSLLAGHFFLTSPWKRAVLALVVYPIAILRNGLRVCVIGELCVRYGPEMIDSYIHRQGGPIFFTISLIPFFLILWLLIKFPHRRPQPTTPVS